MPMLFTDACSSDNQIVFANDSFLHLTGHSRAEVLAHSFESLIAPGADARVLATIKAAFQSSSEGKFTSSLHGSSDTDPQIRYLRKDGSEFWASLYISPVKDNEGRVCQYFVSLVDQTLHRREREQSELLMGELDYRVNNTLARVESLAQQSSEDAADPEPTEAGAPIFAPGPLRASAAAILLVIAIGTLDYVSTPVVALGILYLLAIALAAWKANRTAGLIVAAFALATWAVVEHLANASDPSPAVFLWNVAARVTSFVLVALLVSALCQQKRRQEAINKRLRASIDAADRSAARLSKLQGELQLICSWTNRIRSEGRWMRFEEFMQRNFEIKFTHGISKEAAERVRKLR
jgi:PAS domain S-box-containing protein